MARNKTKDEIPNGREKHVEDLGGVRRKDKYDQKYHIKFSKS